MEIETTFVLPLAGELVRRLQEERRFLQIVYGGRQVGKTTLSLQVVQRSGLPHHFASADVAQLRDHNWIAEQWAKARLLADQSERKESLLVLDEVQKIPHWSEIVKLHWDEDTRHNKAVKVLLLNSFPLLMGKGMTESLAGRFETLYLPHWSFPEMHQLFGWDLQQYLFYGAYPGAASLIEEPSHWARHIEDSLIETTVSRDVLLLARIDKPVLLRRLFALGCAYSGQLLSYTKMLGQLQDAGNTTTLAHYLDLLAGASILAGLQKYSGDAVQQRASSPKLQVFNTALISVQSDKSFEEAQADKEFWGRLTESAVGAHLLNAAAARECTLFYWREKNHEVDFIVKKGQHLLAIEVKSGRHSLALPGLEAFAHAFPEARKLLVGAGGVSIEEFLSTPVAYWLNSG